MIYRFGQYTVDTERLELRRADCIVKVEPQVFRLIVHLIENRDRVVSKDNLLESVWAGRVVSEATMNTRINAARRAIGDTGRDQSIIRTFPRQGFRFVANVEESSTSSGSRDARTIDDDRGTPASADDTRPTIVVLPFYCVGEDDEGFGAGLASMMVTELSRRTGVNVVGREVSLRYSKEPATFTDIRRFIGADYALTGTVHRIARSIRVSVELCETVRGRGIWAEHYDRELVDVFSVQDELCHTILMSTRWNMTAHDGARASEKEESEMSASDRLSRAAQCFYTPTPESYGNAIELLDSVLRDEPGQPMALSMLAFGHYVLSTFRTAPLTREERARIIAYADTGLKWNERSDFGHWIRGTLALNLERDHDAATAHARRANEINPHFSASRRLEGEILCFAGDPKTGISILDELIAADPRAPGNAIALWDLALARFALGEFPQAASAIDQAIVRIQTMPDFHLTRAAVLSELDRVENARTIIDNLMSKYGHLAADRIRHPPFRLNRDVDKYINALRKAGMPD